MLLQCEKNIGTVPPCCDILPATANTTLPNAGTIPASSGKVPTNCCVLPENCGPVPTFMVQDHQILVLYQQLLVLCYQMLVQYHQRVYSTCHFNSVFPLHLFIHVVISKYKASVYDAP
jgi:hypothetical protein